MNNLQNIDSIESIYKLSREQLTKKILSMTPSEVQKLVKDNCEHLVQEIKENKIDLNESFKKFAHVWYSMSYGCDELIVQSLNNFTKILADNLPEYRYKNPVEGSQPQLNSVIRQELANFLVYDDDCKSNHRDCIIMNVTDYHDMKNKKDMMRKNNTVSDATKLKNN